MALRDLLRIEIDQGRLADRFSPRDVRRLITANGGTLSGESVDRRWVPSTLSNLSVGTGYQGASVKRGVRPHYQRHERGSYSLLADEAGHSEKSRGKRSSRAAQSLPTASTAIRDFIAERFCEYIRHMPYRQLETHGRTRPTLSFGRVVLGWEQRLNEYNYDGRNWTATQALVTGFVKDLAALRLAPSDAKALCVYEAIRLWGNPRGSKRSGATIRALLKPLWMGGTISKVDSTLTKLYACAAPGNFVIYDSRVATAIVSIAEDIFRVKALSSRRWVDTAKVFQGAYPHLGVFPGDHVAGTRPRGTRFKWRRARAVVAAQYEANDLCQRICAVLNKSEERSKRRWTLREVEAVLFMAGY